MSAVNSDKSYVRQFLTITCPCGRSLRAKVESIGTEIRCWDCQRMVVVPAPHSSGQALRAWGQSWSAVFQSESLGLLLLVAAALTGVLTIPLLGIALAIPVLIAIAWGFGELVRRSGLDDAADPGRPGLGLLAVRALAVLAAGLLVAAPFLLSPGGVGRPPRFVGLTLAIVAPGVFIAPLLLTMAFARDRSGPLKAKQLASAVRWHPCAVLCALALAPLAFLLTEGLTFALAYHFNCIALFLLDLFPTPDPQLVMKAYHLPYYLNYSFGYPADSRFLALYGFRLRHGYTLATALPASLPVPKALLFNPWSTDLSDSAYLLVRVLFTFLISTLLLTAGALQARWLGLLATIESRLASRAD